MSAGRSTKQIGNRPPKGRSSDRSQELSRVACVAVLSSGEYQDSNALLIPSSKLYRKER